MVERSSQFRLQGLSDFQFDESVDAAGQRAHLLSALETFGWPTYVRVKVDELLDIPDRKPAEVLDLLRLIEDRMALAMVETTQREAWASAETLEKAHEEEKSSKEKKRLYEEARAAQVAAATFVSAQRAVWRHVADLMAAVQHHLGESDDPSRCLLFAPLVFRQGPRTGYGLTFKALRAFGQRTMLPRRQRPGERRRILGPSRGDILFRYTVYASNFERETKEHAAAARSVFTEGELTRLSGKLEAHLSSQQPVHGWDRLWVSYLGAYCDSGNPRWMTPVGGESGSSPWQDSVDGLPPIASVGEKHLPDRDESDHHGESPGADAMWADAGDDPGDVTKLLYALAEDDSIDVPDAFRPLCKALREHKALGDNAQAPKRRASLLQLRELARDVVRDDSKGGAQSGRERTAAEESLLMVAQALSRIVDSQLRFLFTKPDSYDSESARSAVARRLEAGGHADRFRVLCSVDGESRYFLQGDPEWAIRLHLARCWLVRMLEDLPESVVLESSASSLGEAGRDAAKHMMEQGLEQFVVDGQPHVRVRFGRSDRLENDNGVVLAGRLVREHLMDPLCNPIETFRRAQGVISGRGRAGVYYLDRALLRMAGALIAYHTRELLENESPTGTSHSPQGGRWAPERTNLLRIAVRCLYREVDPARGAFTDRSEIGSLLQPGAFGRLRDELPSSIRYGLDTLVGLRSPTAALEFAQACPLPPDSVTYDVLSPDGQYVAMSRSAICARLVEGPVRVRFHSPDTSCPRYEIELSGAHLRVLR